MCMNPTLRFNCINSVYYYMNTIKTHGAAQRTVVVMYLAAARRPDALCT